MYITCLGYMPIHLVYFEFLCRIVGLSLQAILKTSSLSASGLPTGQTIDWEDGDFVLGALAGNRL